MITLLPVGVVGTNITFNKYFYKYKTPRDPKENADEILDLQNGLARLLRISRLEIDNIEDRNYLNDIIGSFMAVVGTILALISLFGGK